MLDESPSNIAPPNIMVEGRDYAVDPLGRWVFSRSYLLSRGRCCGSGCANCPYRSNELNPPIDAPPPRR